MKKFTIRKFDGDDSYSWAVFRTQDVKGMRGIIFYGQARPVMNGMSRTEAGYQRDSLEKRS
tara:strand:+ start:475 stop:657 length:183 start_codon:yes stop_codon:yes gene_type:complete